jgi:hypothetical protein
MTRNAFSKTDDIDKIRRIYWFEGVRLATGTATTYALERVMEPEGFGRNKDGIPINRNKWAAYKRGEHTPKEALVARVNVRVRGSSREINHVLWKVLRQSVNVPTNSINWFRQLDPELQILIFDGDGNIRNHLGRQIMEKIELRTSMDALACLTILLRLNIENGNFEQAREFARSALRVLLMLGHHLESRKIGNDLFDMYIERIFNKIRWDEQRFYFDEYAFSQWAGVLHLATRNTTESDEHMIPSPKRVKHMCRILRGKFGFDIKFATDPLIGPDRDIGPPRKEILEAFDQAVRFQNRSVNILLSGGKKHPSPPKESDEHPPPTPIPEEPKNS